MLDRKFAFSISLRHLVGGIMLLILAGVGFTAYKWNHDKNMAAQKDEYRRRLRFLDASNKTYAADVRIMDSYDAGELSFGLARRDAFESQGKLDQLAKTPFEHDLVTSAEEIGRIYSDCRGKLTACEGRIDDEEIHYKKIFDELMQEAHKMDWRTPEQKGDDDPLAEESEK